MGADKATGRGAPQLGDLRLLQDGDEREGTLAVKKRSRSHVRLPVLMSDWTTGCSDVSIGRCETA